MLAKLANGGTTKVVDLARAGRIITGNFQGFSKGQFGAWTGMWGHYLPQNNQLQATSAMRVNPTRFPAWTRFSWDVTPDPDWGGVNGFLAVSFGNYDDSPGVITSRQVKNISALSVAIDWSFVGNPNSGLLCETWLTPTSTPSGGVTKSCEVAFFPKTSASAAAFLGGLGPVGAGSFTDSNGVLWNVRVSDTYYIAYPPGYAEFRGVLPFRDYFAFLTASGIITGNEWFNGLGFGVEPHDGAGSLTIKKFTPTYLGS